MMVDFQSELNESKTTTSVDIPILNDNWYELTEHFTVNLSFSGEPIPGVMFNPSSAEVVILDDDGKW